MSYWCYHYATGSVYPVPASTDSEVAILAEKLKHRIYFEAELTTQPIERDVQWWVKDEKNNLWNLFLIEEEAREYATESGFPLFRRELRDHEVFMIKQEESVVKKTRFMVYFQETGVVKEAASQDECWIAAWADKPFAEGYIYFIQEAE